MNCNNCKTLYPNDDKIHVCDCCKLEYCQDCIDIFGHEETMENILLLCELCVKENDPYSEESVSCACDK